MHNASAGASSYSLAFQTFVTEEEDLVGLLAYALYKQAIRETIMNGGTVQPSQRQPTPTMVAAFRGDAERKLENFAARSIEEAKPDILQSGIVPATNAAKTAIIQALHARTSMWSNIAANLVAWVIQLQQAPPPAPPPR